MIIKLSWERCWWLGRLNALGSQSLCHRRATSQHRRTITICWWLLRWRWRRARYLVAHRRVRGVLGWLGHGSVTRRSWLRRHIRSGLITRLIICLVGRCVRVVPATHSLFNGCIDMALPQRQRIAFGEFYLVWIRLDVTADRIEVWLLPESKNGFVTHLYFCMLLYTCSAARSPLRTWPP